MEYFEQWYVQAFLILLCLAHAIAVLVCDTFDISAAL